MSVPVLPPLDGEVLSVHQRMHADVLTGWQQLADLQAAPVARMFLQRILIESHAKVQAVESDERAELFARPRAFLTAEQELRLAAAAAAFRHVDSRQAMVARGDIVDVIDASTPIVLNGIFEGLGPTGIEANAGLLRATQSKWLPEKNPMQHPAPAAVPELFAATIDLATRAPAPAIARAGWLAFTMLSIHPFVDGNGRTARMLFQAVASRELPLRMDWGVVEQFSRSRSGYISSLQAGQRCATYAAAELDPLPFMKFALESSIAGARLTSARLSRIGAAHRHLTTQGLSASAACVRLAVELWGIASLKDLSGLGLEPAELTEMVNELVGADLLTWRAMPASRRPVGAVSDNGLAVAS